MSRGAESGDEQRVRNQLLSQERSQPKSPTELSPSKYRS